MTPITKISHQIHKRESILFIINKAELGVKPYTFAYKDINHRDKVKAKAQKELEGLRVEREKLKAIIPKELWYPNKKHCGISKGETRHIKHSNRNTFLCSDGTRVTQAQIDKKRSEAYRIKYQDNPTPIDEGFREKRAKCTAHIISQARCKQIGKTELIWDIDNMFPATFESNSAIENPKGDAWLKLHNKDYCLSFIEKHDPELFSKFESRLATQNTTI